MRVKRIMIVILRKYHKLAVLVAEADALEGMPRSTTAKVNADSGVHDRRR